MIWLLYKQFQELHLATTNRKPQNRDNNESEESLCSFLARRELENVILPFFFFPPEKVRSKQ